MPAAAPGGQCPRCLLSLGSASSLRVTLEDALLDAGQVRSFGSYELLEEIARGGMGVVYRARQRELGREVAIKMILTGQLATTESVQRFRNEAATAARLDHPNIVSIYEIGEYETQHYFSMRLVLGRRNIANWATNLTGSPSERGRRIAVMLAKAARAVAFAHERGVLHRDLKPPNILVDDKDEPQVTDFGLAEYDLASLLYDPYVAIPREECVELLEYYEQTRTRGGSPVDGDFREIFRLCAIQRLMQALGAYGFLGLVKGNTAFLEHIDAALDSLRSLVGETPGLEALHAALFRLPPRGQPAAET